VPASSRQISIKARIDGIDQSLAQVVPVIGPAIDVKPGRVG
jgi:hypothetical protein